MAYAAPPAVNKPGLISVLKKALDRLAAGGTATICAATFAASTASGKQDIHRWRIDPPLVPNRCEFATACDHSIARVVPALTRNHSTVVS
jgi:hypothetical protein